mgnify:CR=1 FL=1|tara:strand:+ start:2528 stop:3097 length:570 start_codon:yes stop_codon:yes gene_type:complete
MIKISELNPDNINSNKTENNPNCLIVVTHPNCHYCNVLEPTLKNLYSKLENYYSGNFEVLGVHGDVVNQLINKIPELEKVDGFPTIIATKENEEPVLYSGDRSQKDIESFLKKIYEMEQKGAIKEFEEGIEEGIEKRKNNSKMSMEGGKHKTKKHRTKKHRTKKHKTKKHKTKKHKTKKHKSKKNKKKL